MRVGVIVVVIWIVIGLLAAGQRGYFSGSDKDCSRAGSTLVPVSAGSLNYLGVNPKVTCEPPPQPSQ
jgi:hypothetical protein